MNKTTLISALLITALVYKVQAFKPIKVFKGHDPNEMILFLSTSTYLDLPSTKIIDGFKQDGPLDNAIKIYPNPATTTFKLQGLKVDNVELYNILGSKVLEFRNTNNIDVSNLKTGAYLVKITIKKNSITKKLIIIQ